LHFEGDFFETVHRVLNGVVLLAEAVVLHVEQAEAATEVIDEGRHSRGHLVESRADRVDGEANQFLRVERMVQEITGNEEAQMGGTRQDNMASYEEL